MANSESRTGQQHAAYAGPLSTALVVESERFLVALQLPSCMATKRRESDFPSRIRESMSAVSPGFGRTNTLTSVPPREF